MLRWQQDWGTKTAHWEKMIELGRKVPEPFLDKPEILPAAAFYWVAFCDLVTERPIGMSLGPIPHSRARAYAIMSGIASEDAFDRFWSIIREVDSESLKLMNAAADEDAPSAKRPTKPVAAPLDGKTRPVKGPKQS